MAGQATCPDCLRVYNVGSTPGGGGPARKCPLYAAPSTPFEPVPTGGVLHRTLVEREMADHRCNACAVKRGRGNLVGVAGNLWKRLTARDADRVLGVKSECWAPLFRGTELDVEAFNAFRNAAAPRAPSSSGAPASDATAAAPDPAAAPPTSGDLVAPCAGVCTSAPTASDAEERVAPRLVANPISPRTVLRPARPLREAICTELASQSASQDRIGLLAAACATRGASISPLQLHAGTAAVVAALVSPLGTQPAAVPVPHVTPTPRAAGARAVREDAVKKRKRVPFADAEQNVAVSKDFVLTVSRPGKEPITFDSKVAFPKDAKSMRIVFDNLKIVFKRIAE